ARRDVDNRADILFAPIYARATSLQAGTEDVFVSQLTYAFGLLGQRWRTGWNVYYTTSNERLAPRLQGDLVGRSIFDLDRIDAGAFLAWIHPWVEPGIEVRRIEYTEASKPRNDYEATIVAMTLTRRFGSASLSQP